MTNKQTLDISGKNLLKGLMKDLSSIQNKQHHAVDNYKFCMENNMKKDAQAYLNIYYDLKEAHCSIHMIASDVIDSIEISTEEEEEEEEEEENDN